MGDWWDVKQRWRQRWIHWRRQTQRRWEAWCIWRQAVHAQRRKGMEAVEQDLILEGVAEAILSQPGSSKLEEVLLAKVWERHHEQLMQQAIEQVHQEQQEAETARHERWQAQKAQEHRGMVQEAEQLMAEGISQGMAEERQDFAERRQRLISQRNEARARADAAEAWIVEHLKELLPDGRRVLLRNPELTTFRMHSVNLILSRLGFEVKARLTDTPEVVATEVGPSHWEQQSRFRLVTIVPGVIDEEADTDEADESASMLEASPDGSTV